MPIQQPFKYNVPSGVVNTLLEIDEPLYKVKISKTQWIRFERINKDFMEIPEVIPNSISKDIMSGIMDALKRLLIP